MAAPYNPPVKNEDLNFAVAHLSKTFSRAERNHRELMEPYTVMLADARDVAVRVAIMEEGLRATFRRRYPLP